MGTRFPFLKTPTRANPSKLATCQSLSGTGALHLAGLLLRACHTPLPKVYIPAPTWTNHHQVFSSLGFACETFKYYDDATKDMDFDSYCSALEAAEPNSVVILHACAHNPTGLDPSEEQWRQIGRLMKEKQLFPLFDAAYLGFNSGNVDHDAHAIRLFVEELNMEAAVCLSFAKNMGLYGMAIAPIPNVPYTKLSKSAGERVGCFILATNADEAAVNTQSMLEMLQRSEISNPPAYGAKVASNVLRNNDMRQAWYADLETMSGRIRSMRKMLYEHLVSHGRCCAPLLDARRSNIRPRCSWFVGSLASPVGNVWIPGPVARRGSRAQRLVATRKGQINANSVKNREIPRLHGGQFSSLHRGPEPGECGIRWSFHC